MLRRRISATAKCVLAFALLCVAPVVHAASSTANLGVQLIVNSACTISASSLNFGTVVGTNLLTVATNASATLSVTCTNGNPYSIGMDNGVNASGSQRRMTNGSSFINYGLFLDTLRVNAWTTAVDSLTCTTASSCHLGTGSGSSQSVTIYGQVPIVALAPGSGTYTDTVTVTINY